MEARIWIQEAAHWFPYDFTIEEDSEDGSTAPVTSVLLEDVCSQS